MVAPISSFKFVPYIYVNSYDVTCIRPSTLHTHLYNK
jgi:hypothetical protein